MTFKERIDALKGKLQAKVTSEATAEQLADLKELTDELDSLNASHDEVVTEQAKLKDTIVRMALTQGDSNKPGDGADGSKPMTIEEAVAEVQKGGK